MIWGRKRQASESPATLRDLFDSLDARRRPEDAAQMVLEVLANDLDRHECRLLKNAAKGSIKQAIWGFTAMMQDFSRPDGMERQVRRAEVIFKTARQLSAAECSKPEVLEGFITDLGKEIRKTFGRSDFKQDRLNRAQREDVGLDISKRRYNKLFRHLLRMEKKLQRFLRELKKREFTLVGKSGLASKLSWEDFSTNANTACFIAYLTGRSNLRSEFTISGQQRAYDEIADMLFQRCLSDEKTNWWAIAHAYPDREVLRRLYDQQRGELLGQWHGLLVEISQLLAEVWSASELKRDSMIVQRGNDSSTWNNTANAWNKARMNWIALLHAMGMERMLNEVCPGKVLRLMAADVVAWHRSTGGSLDPDTLVWRDLPLPWEVLNGHAMCTKTEIEATCGRHGIDPVKKGWIAPAPKGKPVPFRMTPELVHGVAVSSPALAAVLRTAGWFSGKSAGSVECDVTVRLDEHGFVVGAEPGNDPDQPCTANEGRGK